MAFVFIAGAIKQITYKRVKKSSLNNRVYKANPMACSMCTDKLFDKCNPRVFLSIFFFGEECIKDKVIMPFTKWTLASYRLSDGVQLRCRQDGAHLDSSPVLSRSDESDVLSSTSSGGSEWGVWSWLTQDRWGCLVSSSMSSEGRKSFRGRRA